jgi:hypothetical protein
MYRVVQCNREGWPMGGWRRERKPLRATCCGRERCGPGLQIGRQGPQGVHVEAKRARDRERERERERESNAGKERKVATLSHMYATRTQRAYARRATRVVSRSRVCDVRDGLRGAEREREREAQSRSRSHPRDPRQAAPASAVAAAAATASTHHRDTKPKRWRVRLVPCCEPHAVRSSFTSRDPKGGTRGEGRRAATRRVRERVSTWRYRGDALRC